MLFDFVRAAFASPRTACTDLSRRLRDGVSLHFSPGLRFSRAVTGWPALLRNPQPELARHPSQGHGCGRMVSIRQLESPAHSVVVHAQLDHYRTVKAATLLITGAQVSLPHPAPVLIHQLDGNDDPAQKILELVPRYGFISSELHPALGPTSVSRRACCSDCVRIQETDRHEE